MSNEVAKANSAAGSLAINVDQLRAGLSNVRETMKETGGTPFLRLQKDGSWVFGSDDADIAPKTEAVINPMSIKHGFSCWTDRKAGEGKNELLGEVMVSAQQAKPMPHELDKKTDEKTGRECDWRDQNAIDLRLIGGKHNGTQVVFKTTAVGGIRVIRALLDAVIDRVSEGEATYLCPIVELASDSYKHSTYGKIFTPVMEIVGWADVNGNEAPDAEDAPAAVEEEVAVEEAPVEETPARRRRRA